MKNKTPKTSTDNFIDEVNEDLKNDQMKKVWKKYGLWIVIGMAVILAVAVSFESIKAVQKNAHKEQSDLYAQALSLQNQGRFDESLVVLKNIVDADKNVYADVAKVQIANIYFEQGKNDEAVKTLEGIINDSGANKKMRDISIIKLASYKLDNAPAGEVEKLLEPLVKENGSWTSIAKEMLAMLAIRDGNIEKAKTIYTEILNSPSTSDSLKTRVKDMLSVLNSGE